MIRTALILILLPLAAGTIVAGVVSRFTPVGFNSETLTTPSGFPAFSCKIEPRWLQLTFREDEPRLKASAVRWQKLFSESVSFESDVCRLEMVLANAKIEKIKTDRWENALKLLREQTQLLNAELERCRGELDELDKTWTAGVAGIQLTSETYSGWADIARAFNISVPLWMLLLLLLGYPLGQVLLHGPIRRYFRRRRGLCEKCGYDLTGNTSGICPECGRETGQGRRDVDDSEGVKVKTCESENVQKGEREGGRTCERGKVSA